MAKKKKLFPASVQCDTPNGVSKQRKDGASAAKYYQRKRKTKKECKGTPNETPNYFISIQITNKEMLKKLHAIQEYVCEKEPSLSGAMVPLCTLHLTLLVLRLEDNTQVQRARDALDHCTALLEVMSPYGRKLTFEGIGHFTRSVVFAKIRDDDTHQVLQFMAETIKDCFAHHGLPSTDSRTLHAHATICKTSRMRRVTSGRPKINVSAFKDFKDDFFGVETMKTLQLCSMLLPKDESGYYQVLHSTDLKLPQKITQLKQSSTQLGQSIGELKQNAHQLEHRIAQLEEKSKQDEEEGT